MLGLATNLSNINQSQNFRPMSNLMVFALLGVLSGLSQCKLKISLID